MQNNLMPVPVGEREERKRRRLKAPPKDFDRLFYLGRLRRDRGSRCVLVQHDASDPSELLYAREIETAIDEGLNAWIAGIEAEGWLAEWLNEHVTDPIERSILSLKKADPWKTQKQIADAVNSEFGTKFSHDKVQRVLSTAKRQLNTKLDIHLRKLRQRASGIEPDGPDAEKWCKDLGYHSDVPIGKWQAMSTLELDEDGYKLHRKYTALSRPKAA